MLYKKRHYIMISSFVLTIFLTGIFSSWVKASTPENNKPQDNGIKVEARSGLLMEPSTGKILYEYNSHEKLAPASVTKIMTMLLIMEAVDSGKIKMTDKVTISENAKKMGGSSMILDTGEVRTVEELIKGVAIASGNDAAVALGEYLAGSEEAFVNTMNQRAESLGMKDTSFKNCTGLSAAGHLTTAYDISIMSRELIKHKAILKYTGTYMETISEGRKTPIGLVNHNKLVRFFKGCDGLKTGFTEEAKYCISSTAEKDGVRMLAVIMGSPSYKIRNKDAGMLMNYGFSKYECKKVVSKDAELTKVELNKKGDRYFIAKAFEDLNIILEKGNPNKVTYKCVLNEKQKKFITKEEVGFCEVYLDGSLVGKVRIYSDRDIKRFSTFDNLKNNFVNILDKGV